MTDKNVQETEKKPAARSRVSRGRTAGQSASAKRRREARKRAMELQAQQGGNGGSEREGSDYRTMVRILDRICAAERMTYGELGIFGALNWLQQEQNGQIHHGQKTRTAGR